MTRRFGAARRGITLTEILISILIMGIGLISLATLFPLGMVRLRAAQQQSRSGLLAETATADLGARSLLFKPSFLASWYAFDPFVNDPIAGGGGLTSSAFGPGLPICYDPLWRFETGITPATADARFGAGVFSGGNSFFRADPDGAGAASGYGLQRLTNFFTTTGWAFVNPETVFVSQDDPVMQNSDATPEVLSTPGGGQAPLSGVVPQNFAPPASTVPQFRNDFRYTWLFTGYQVDATNGTAFVGDVVVMDSRPFGYGPVTSPQPGGAQLNLADGEIPLEAIFGYSANTGGGIGYGIAADRTVLLRWPNAMPDPEIKVGSWIADVTYERTLTLSNTRVANMASAGVPVYPFQRCHWYQISKKSDVQNDSDVAGYRKIVVTVNTPLKARTLLNSGGTAVNLNVALFMPSVVNTFQRAIFVRP